MSTLLTFVTLIAVYLIIGFLIFLVVKKINRTLKNRILLPTSNVSIYLKPIDEIKEAKTKKRWLTTYILTYLFSIISTFSIWLNISTPQPIAAKILTLFFYLISLALSFWITYHCAYKKQGSAFLLLLLITIPISTIVTLVSQLNQTFYWPQFSLLTLILLFINFGLNALFWVVSFELRKVNLVRRYHLNALILKEKFQKLNS
jgi:hypothetical protein